MDKDFITIGEAARLLRQADIVVMRLLKEALEAGVERDEIMKAEMRNGRMMYLIKKSFLQEQMEKEETRGEEETPQEGRQLREERGEDSFRGLLSAKESMIETLQSIVNKKDEQIEDLSRKIDQLIERDHETNILLKGLQDRLFLLEQGDTHPDKEENSKKRKKG